LRRVSLTKSTQDTRRACIYTTLNWQLFRRRANIVDKPNIR
jgi:hypothetical protein